MKKFKQLGIWMDDSNALIMEFFNHTIVSKSIVFKPVLNEESLNVNEENPDSQAISNPYEETFFREISEIVVNYQEVLLLGPTQSKYRLLESLKNNHNYENIKFDVADTDKMTENEMHEFVIDYFK